jgi:hypothetical protein
MHRVNDREHWQLRGLVDALGVEGAAETLGVTARELADSIYPGTGPGTLAKIRKGLKKRQIVAFVPLGSGKRGKA